MEHDEGTAPDYGPLDIAAGSLRAMSVASPQSG